MPEKQSTSIYSRYASNMVKPMSTLPSFGCFAHSLQLVVNNGALSQRAVTELLSTSRKIVGHFCRSSLANNRLREIQSNLGLPLHQLIQDEPTQWNSALYMLKRIVEQKMAIGALPWSMTFHSLVHINWSLQTKL